MGVSGIVGRAIKIALMVGFIAFSQSPRARAEKFNFDPALCKQGEHGKIYIALGRYVFPMGYATQQAVVDDPLLTQESRLALNVPDPEEPKGCFGNPLQSGSYALFTPAILAKGGQLVSVASALQLLTLYRLDRGETPQSSDAIWPGEALELRIAESTCKGATVREELPNGMSACRFRPNDPSIPREEWGTTYRARSDVYMTATKRLFTVNCSGTRYPCTVAYEIAQDLGVSYRLFPHRNGTSAPIDHVIEIDRSIRAAFYDSIVKDYPWPDHVIDNR